jgi:hypothetical protein
MFFPGGDDAVDEKLLRKFTKGNASVIADFLGVITKFPANRRQKFLSRNSTKTLSQEIKAEALMYCHTKNSVEADNNRVDMLGVLVKFLVKSEREEIYTPTHEDLRAIVEMPLGDLDCLDKITERFPEDFLRLTLKFFTKDCGNFTNCAMERMDGLIRALVYKLIALNSTQLGGNFPQPAYAAGVIEFLDYYGNQLQPAIDAARQRASA